MNYVDHNFIEVTQQTKLRVALVMSIQSSSSCRASRAVLFDNVDTAKMHVLATCTSNVSSRAKCNFGLLQYNTIQCSVCSSAQSTKYGRLCITMSVNEWDSSYYEEKAQLNKYDLSARLKAVDNITKCSRKTIPHNRTANRICMLPELTSCASYGGGSGSWTSEVTSLWVCRVKCNQVSEIGRTTFM